MQFSKQIEKDSKLDFSGNETWNLAVIASLPIFDSGANYTKLRKAKYELMETELKMDDTRENILVGAKNSFYNLITNARKVSNNKLALEHSRENHKIINSLYDQGMATNSDLLDAEVMLFASEMNLASAYYDYILANYELKKYTNE